MLGKLSRTSESNLVLCVCSMYVYLAVGGEGKVFGNVVFGGFCGFRMELINV